MLFTKSVFALPIVVAGVWLPAGHAWADPSNVGNQAAKPALQVSLRNEEFLDGAGGRQVQRVYLTSGTNEFVFVVPEGLRVDASNPEKIVLNDGHYSFFLAFRLAGPMPAGEKGLQAAFCRSLASSRFPDAEVSNEFSELVASHNSPAFDLQWKSSGGVAHSARLVFVPSSAGVMEFSLVANPGNFDNGLVVFRILLSSFRTNEGGKIQIIPLSANS